MTSQTLIAENRPAIRAEGLAKTYRRGGVAARVLDGVDLLVEAGQCVFLAGPSGSGKTTLLSILGCILTADAGRLEILGTDLSRFSPPERTRLRRDRIGFIFQRFYLIRGLSALDNVCVPMTLQGVSDHAARTQARAILESVGLGAKLNAHATSLSGGECQRVAIARALANNPDLILADEPTASLDAANGREVMQLLRQLTSQQGKTAIVVTHDQRIFRYADRVYCLENGRIAESFVEEPEVAR